MLRLERFDRWLLVSTLLVAVALVLTTVPAPFTIDDCNYLTSTVALEHGQVTVPGTETLSPTRELLAFDPSRHGRIVTRSPVAPAVPALYAPLALPFSFAGWRALVLINALGVAATVFLTYLYVREVTTARAPALLAAASLLLGGAVIDYGQGMWPHGLSLVLTSGAFVLAAFGRRNDTLLPLALAGALLGWACGVRYQNAIVLASIGLVVLAWHPRRIRASLCLALGAAPFLVAASLINRVRLGTFNPVSKGGTYLTGLAQGSFEERLSDALLATYARVVDFSANPPLEGAISLLPKDPVTGTFLFLGGLKKAWLQSSPWLAIVLVALLIAWVPFVAGKKPAEGEAASENPRSWTRDCVRELRALSIPIFIGLAVFGWAGTQRNEGWCFNQRYLMELMPLTAMGLGLAVGMRMPRLRTLWFGGFLGVLLALPFLLKAPGDFLRSEALMYVPLVLAVLCLVTWGLSRWSASSPLLGIALGAALGWSLAVHVGDDARAARGRRSYNLKILDEARRSIDGERLALVTAPGTRDAVCALHLERDLVLVDPSADRGADLPRLVNELLEQGERRVYVLGWLPPDLLAKISKGRMQVVKDTFFPIIELRDDAPAPAPLK